MLRCRECNEEYPPDKITLCSQCLAPLDVTYELDYTSIRRETFETRDRTIWRYFELLPILDKKNIVELGVGFTPLMHASNLGELIGLRKLYIKNDSVNPTFSFKDRPAEVGVSKAIEFGDNVVCCVSTGNLAASVAAHAAKARIKSYVLAPSDIEPEKISQIIAYNAHIIFINGSYDDANRLALIASYELGWNVINITSRPYYVEGSKTIAFELCEQLSWSVPDNVVIPVASGALLLAIYNGFKQLLELGLIDRLPRLIGAQAEGCAPLARAFKENSTTVKPVERADTIAKSIAIGDPADGRYVLKAVRDTNGLIEEASDSDIINSIFDLAGNEGIFTEPAGSVTIAVARKLHDKGYIDSDESTVCLITGNGLKTQGIIAEHRRKGQDLIEPKISELKRIAIREVSVNA